MLNIKTRKIILWSVTVVLAAILIFLWLKDFRKQITNFEGGGIFGKLNFPKIEMPQLPEINYGENSTTTTE